jgi:hypothetical protein
MSHHGINSARVTESPLENSVTLPHQLFSQVRNDALRAAIRVRRAALCKWCNLRNLHRQPGSCSTLQSLDDHDRSRADEVHGKALLLPPTEVPLPQ